MQSQELSPVLKHLDSLLQQGKTGGLFESASGRTIACRIRPQEHVHLYPVNEPRNELIAFRNRAGVAHFVYEETTERNDPDLKAQAFVLLMLGYFQFPPVTEVMHPKRPPYSHYEYMRHLIGTEDGNPIDAASKTWMGSLLGEQGYSPTSVERVSGEVLVASFSK